MNKTIDYLEEKNIFLEKFLGLNREWLDRLSRGDFSDLESFRENRENILNIIKHIDTLVESHSRKIDVQEVEINLKNKVNILLERKDALVKVILSQDLEIMEMIEHAKSQIILELKSVQKSKKSIGSYKSFNRKEILDEEV